MQWRKELLRQNIYVKKWSQGIWDTDREKESERASENE
jgi:hypothetical protein